MAEDKLETREINYRQWLPWTHIFRGFWVAIDPKKLLLAAAGILVMAFGWWLLATIFYNTSHKPSWSESRYAPAAYQQKDDPDPQAAAELRAFRALKRDRDRWNLLHEAAGTTPELIEAEDIAETPKEFDDAQKQLAKGAPEVQLNGRTIRIGYKPYGKLNTWPWFEPRGPNPFLLITGQAGAWERGHFFDWLLRDEIPVLIEPLVKFLRPIIYLLKRNPGFFEGLYFLLVLGWTVATWAVFGGAIARMAAVEIARNDKVSLGEALRQADYEEQDY